MIEEQTRIGYASRCWDIASLEALSELFLTATMGEGSIVFVHRAGKEIVPEWIALASQRDPMTFTKYSQWIEMHVAPRSEEIPLYKRGRFDNSL